MNRLNPVLLAAAIIGMGAALLLMAAAFLFAPPMDYVVRAEFERLPASDTELEKWLLSQPGVYIGFIERQGNTVVLVWGHSRTHYWDPVTPDVRPRFERFGYKGLNQYRQEKSYRDK